MPTLRDHERLKGVHPTLQAAILKILEELPMFVVEGVRTVARQQALYAQGRTLLGSKVTDKDGVHHKSNHQPHADGLGHAVDCAWLGPSPFALTHPWASYGATSQALGLIWGGSWKTLIDLPHVELPDHPLPLAV
jgi:peptidoglycan L-alanyl-D-glutamate endopeptidase CwlK